MERWEIEVEGCGFEVGDGSGERKIPEASCYAFGQFELAIDGFNGGAGYPAPEESEDSFPMILECAGELLKRHQATP